MLFLIRFTTFLAAIITLVIASKMTGNAHITPSYCKSQLPQHSKKTRIIAWCISATLCITAILEIALGNRNEFTSLKIVFYIFVWCAVTWLELDKPAYSWVLFISYSPKTHRFWDFDLVRSNKNLRPVSRPQIFG